MGCTTPFTLAEAWVTTPPGAWVTTPQAGVLVDVPPVAGLLFSTSLEAYAAGRAAGSRKNAAPIAAPVVLARGKTLGSTQAGFVCLFVDL